MIGRRVRHQSSKQVGRVVAVQLAACMAGPEMLAEFYALVALEDGTFASWPVGWLRAEPDSAEVPMPARPRMPPPPAY